MLALHIERAHVYRTRHVHQCACRGCGHTMLAGTRLGYDAGLAHTARKEYLPEGVVYLVGARMVEILTLEIQTASITLGHAAGII